MISMVLHVIYNGSHRWLHRKDSVSSSAMSIPPDTYRYITFAVKEVTRGIIISKPDYAKGVMAYYFVPPGYNTAVEHGPVLVNRNAHKNHA
jgi:hypothetical protein